jgi:hypothetical protein
MTNRMAQVESTRLDDAKAIDRLFLVLAVATLHFTRVGVGMVKRKTRRWIDTHWDRGMTCLKIGWKWLRQQFRRGWTILVHDGGNPSSVSHSNWTRTNTEKHGFNME